MTLQQKQSERETHNRGRVRLLNIYLIIALLLVLFLILNVTIIILHASGIIHFQWFDNWNTIFVVTILPCLGIIASLLPWFHSLFPHEESSPSSKIATTLFTPTTITQDTTVDKDIEGSPQHPLLSLWEAPHPEHVYGRSNEQEALNRWISNDGCRMIALLGPGGIGKTTLAETVVRQVKDTFDYVFWRSLLNAPSLETFLEQFIAFLSNPQHIPVPKSIDEQLLLFIESLQKHRCLIVLDNVETILQGGYRAGQYREGYEGYSHLLQYVGEVAHRSCILLTSREKPRQIAHLEGKTRPVRSLQLPGLELKDGRKILEEEGLSGSDATWVSLIDLYLGNPLALKLVAEPIREVFLGDIAAFLKEEKAVIGDISDILEQQFQRLSPQEREVMYWLAIEREATSLDMLLEDIIPLVSKKALLESMKSLRRRFMIEASGIAQFTLQPVIMEYVTDKFVEKICQEIITETFDFFESYALIKAQSKNYLRRSQIHLILKPTTKQLCARFIQEELEKNFQRMLDTLRMGHSHQHTYMAGNILNLLIELNYDLRKYDFSKLNIQQAYLQDVILQDVNFAHANLATSIFTSSFGGITAVALSPNGTFLAAGTTKNSILLYAITNGVLLHTCKGHTNWVQSVAFSRDGHSLASGSEDHTLRIWDVRTATCLHSLQGHTGRVWSIAFNIDGTLLASSSDDYEIKLWEVQSGKCLHTWANEMNTIGESIVISFNPEGHLLMNTTNSKNDYTVQEWKVNPGSYLHLQTWQNHIGHNSPVAFSPDGQIFASIATNDDDYPVKLWEISTGACLHTLQGHTNKVTIVSFSPDGRYLASSGYDYTVKLWEISTGACLHTLQGHMSLVSSLAFSYDGQYLISGGFDQTVRLWEVNTGYCLNILQGYTNNISAIACHPSGHYLASGGSDRTVRLWNISTNTSFSTLQGHTGHVRSIVFHPDGLRLASSGDERVIRIWEVTTGNLLQTLQDDGWVKRIAISPDGRFLASSGHYKNISLWDINASSRTYILQGHTNVVFSVAFSPDGQYLASGSHDHTIRIWNVHDGLCLRILTGHSNEVLSVIFSPDGRYLFSGSHDHTVKIWELESGSCVSTLEDHSDSVNSIAISPNGKYIATGSTDLSVKLWEATNGLCLHTLRGHTDIVTAVAFSPDGHSLMSGSEDGTINVWDTQNGVKLKALRYDRLYERMNITNIKGLSDQQKEALKALGAIEL